MWRIVFILSLFAIACSSGTENLSEQQTPFFDLKGFIQEVTQDSAGISVYKSITVNGEKEEKELNDYAFWYDLQQFENYDINRPALFDKYDTDTIPSGNGSVIRHQAMDSTLHVQLMETFRSGDQSIESIHIDLRSESFLEDMTVDISWSVKDNSYQLRRVTKMIGSDPDTHVVNVRKM